MHSLNLSQSEPVCGEQHTIFAAGVFAPRRFTRAANVGVRGHRTEKFRPTPGSRNRDDDFSDVLVSFHIAVSLNDLVERKSLRDLRFQESFSQAVLDKRPRSFETPTLVNNFKHEIAAHRKSPHR